MSTKENNLFERVNCMNCNVGDVIKYPTGKFPCLIIEKSDTYLKLVSKRQRYRHQELQITFNRMLENTSGILPEKYENLEYQLLLDDGRKWLAGKIRGTMNVRK
jgi:hypothetical protein